MIQDSFTDNYPDPMIKLCSPKHVQGMSPRLVKISVECFMEGNCCLCSREKVHSPQMVPRGWFIWLLWIKPVRLWPVLLQSLNFIPIIGLASQPCPINAGPTLRNPAPSYHSLAPLPFNPARTFLTQHLQSHTLSSRPNHSYNLEPNYTKTAHSICTRPHTRPFSIFIFWFICKKIWGQVLKISF